MKLFVPIALLSLAGCLVGDDPAAIDDPDEASADLSSFALQAASTFNANPFKATNGEVDYECITPAAGGNTSVPGRFLDGTPTFYSWRALDFNGTTCQTGQLRIARWERLTIAGASSYLMRGGGGTNADDAGGGIRFGHVAASELAKDTSLLGKYLPGNVGQAPASCGGKIYTIDPAKGTTPELSALYYKPQQPSASGAKWDNYGDQGGYAYALWTWPELPDGGYNRGGGEPRAVLQTGEQIRRCDVSAAYLPMFRANSSSSVGRVKMVYARVRDDAGQAVYGWVAIGWQLNGKAWHYFVD